MQIKQIQTSIESFLQVQEGILSTIRIGSAGRGQLGPNSDLDYQLILDNDALPADILQAFERHFGNFLRYAITPASAPKAALYFGEQLSLCELMFYRQKEELDKYFLGSEIHNVLPCIVFDRTRELTEYLQLRVDVWCRERKTRLKNEVLRLVDEFTLRFEACSRAHVRSDGYKFSVLFGHALNAVVRLVWLASGEEHFDFMPPNFLTKYSHPLKLGLDKLGQIDLRTAHFQKKHLLQLFAEWGPKAAERVGLEINLSEKLGFLERIMVRDRFWNLRDASKFNPRLRSGLLFRSAAFCFVSPAADANNFFREKNISKVIDLRAARELAEASYIPEQLGDAKHVHVPFDPWEQSEAFQKAHGHLIDHSVIAYHFFLKECRESMKAVFSILAESSGAVLIHCHAGKDRTGIVFTLLHLLSGAEPESIHFDYLASEMDTRPELLGIILNEVERQGGIETYLKNCGVTEAQIHKIRERLCLPPTN